MNHKTILVVDDEPDLREAVQTSLIAAGFNVLAASNGQGGYALAIANHPDLILMDINMPKMNGHEAVRKLRLDPWGKSARVIYLTSHGDPENIFTAITQGSHDYVVKSDISLDSLVHKCKEVIATTR